MAKRARAEERRLSYTRVVKSMQKVKYVFTEEVAWASKLWADMGAEEQACAEERGKKPNIKKKRLCATKRMKTGSANSKRI